MKDQQLLPLPTVPGELRWRYGCVATYRQIYMAVLDGRAEAVRLNGRWYVHPASLEAIAAGFAAGTRAAA